jgi:hypothetical protein
MNFKQAILAIAISSISAVTFGATADGDASDSASTASVDLELQVNDIIKITADGGASVSWDDFTTANVTGTDSTISRTATEGYCVFVNGGGAYGITFSDNSTPVNGNPADQFVLLSEDSNIVDDIPFSLYYATGGKDTNISTITTGGTEVEDGQEVNSLAGYADLDCGAGHNLQVRIDITEGDILNADTANYSTTVSFLVAVE